MSEEARAPGGAPASPGGGAPATGGRTTRVRSARHRATPVEMNQNDDRGLPARARRALAERAHERYPDETEDGYFTSVDAAFVPTVGEDERRRALVQLAEGDGGELLAQTRYGRPPKFQAAHSSAALAVNAFAPWWRALDRLELAGERGFTAMRFEARYPTLPSALSAGRAANLDVELLGDGVVVGVESKLTEHLTPKVRPWRDAYRAAGVLDVLPAPWREEFERSLAAGAEPSLLDAPQLLKHALALARTAANGGFGADEPRLRLVYVFWEPRHEAEHPHVLEHRRAAEALAERVSCDALELHVVPHHDLWARWQLPDAPDWAREHARALATRYLGRETVWSSQRRGSVAS